MKDHKKLDIPQASFISGTLLCCLILVLTLLFPSCWRILVIFLLPAAIVMFLVSWQKMKKNETPSMQAIAPGSSADNPLTPRILILNEQAETPPAADLTVIGTEYRRQQHADFEKTIDAILDAHLYALKHHFHAHTAAIFFPTIDEGYAMRRFISDSPSVAPGVIIRPGLGIIGSFLKSGLKQMKLDDITTSSETLFYYSADIGIRSLMITPILAEKIQRGLILIDSKQCNYFDGKDQYYLQNSAEICGQSVYHAYKHNQRRLDYERLTAMSTTEKIFYKEHSIDTLLDKLTEIIPFAFPCDRLTISLADPENATAIILRTAGIKTEGLDHLTFSLKEKTLASVLYSKNHSFFRNFSRDHYECRFSSREPESNTFVSFIAFPLGVDECKGMLLLESLNKDTYTDSTRELLTRLVSSAGIALERIQLLKQTEDLAIRDALTGLYNRRQLMRLLKESLARSQRCNEPVALVMCDIDQFKKLNDTYGHRFGDKVLKEVADKLQMTLREGTDTAARYGGEEFILILEGTRSSPAKETVERIRQLIQNMRFQTPHGTDINTTMSFGIAVFPLHAKTQENLLKRADQALYRAKAGGRNRVELFLDGNEPA